LTISPRYTAPKRFSYFSLKRSKAQIRWQGFVQLNSTLPLPIESARQALKEINRFLLPQKACDILRPLLKIRPFHPHSLEMETTALRWRRTHDSPPRRQDCQCLFDPALVGNEGRLVDDTAITRDLKGQSIKRIAVRFEFDTANVTVDDRYVDSTSAIQDTQFVHDERSGYGLCCSQQTMMYG
jgi:hypothetical protein